MTETSIPQARDLAQALDLFRWLWNDQIGNVCVAWDRIGDPNTKFKQTFIAWPSAANDLIDSDESTFTHDVWFTPMLYPASERKHRLAQPGRVVWADLDHTDEWTPEQRAERLKLLDSLNAAIVKSGTGDNMHVYVKLLDTCTVDQVQAVNEQLVVALGGDPSKVDGSSLLRFPGTFNHKGQPPQLVVINELRTSFDGWPLTELQMMLPEAPIKAAKLDAAPTVASGRSPVTDALALAFGDPGRGNVWLALVAGYFARTERRSRARYDAILRNINGASTTPIADRDFRKTIDSIWSREQASREAHKQANGWLVGDGERLTTLAEVGSGDDKVKIEAEWANFDVKVRSITRSTDGTLVYTVDLTTAGHVYTAVQLDPSIFSTDSRLTQWLAVRGATILPVPFDMYAGHTDRARLARYLQNQNAASSTAVLHLGWNSDLGQFIAHEGVVSDTGIQPHDGSVPDPILTSWAPYRYGVVPRSEALVTLREVLTYQDETVTSVFLAWWVMALLKGRYQTSQFPFMSIEAPSESGKSTGFFAMMVAMAGNTNGHGRYTPPAFRDALAGHRNGITWLDDMTEIGDLQDMIRQLTAEGHWSKKGMDRRETETIQLLCPLVVSGEGLGSVMSEKAMRDRAIALEVSSPKNRKSLSNPDRPQWDDVQTTLARYGGKPEGMAALAGTLTSLVHEHMGMLVNMAELRPAPGRHGDKMAIIRMGARIASQLLDDPTHVERVDAWCAAQADEGNVNHASIEVIPWFLRSNLTPTSANGHMAVYYDTSAATVWVSPQRLADAWGERKGLSARERQLGTESAIRSELKANGVDLGGKTKWTHRQGGKKARYCELPYWLSQMVMDNVGTADEAAQD